MATEKAHEELVREQFARQAGRFDSYVNSGGNEDVLGWMMGNLELQPHFRALDVAAGTGLVARKIAPSVQTVVAIDATPEMLAQGRQQAQTEGLVNITFDQGDAADLPYSDGSFHLVTCRIAMHHFADPKQQLREMVRVCHPTGTVAIIGITTSDAPAVAATHNRLERLRDPSHTTSLTPGQLLALAENAGLEITVTDRFDARRELDDWMDLTGTPPETRAAITGQFERELNGGSATGMFPFRESDRIMFHHLWVMLVGKKSA